MPTIDQCKAYAEQYKMFGRDNTFSARRATVLRGVSRSCTALAHQYESLAVIEKSGTNAALEANVNYKAPRAS